MATENDKGGLELGTTRAPGRPLIPRQASPPVLRPGMVPGQRTGEEHQEAPRTGAMAIAEVLATQLEILRAVDTWCSTREIRYYLAYGTLLGAVRHHGYIPWDDDIDLMMPRQDYERFCAQFNHSDLAEIYEVGCSANTVEWPYPFAKVSDKRTTLHESGVGAVRLGVNIDIFPIDAFPAGRVRTAAHKAVTDLLRRAHTAKYVVPHSGRSARKRAELALLQALLRPFSLRRITGWWTRWALRPAEAGATSLAVRIGPGHWCAPRAAFADPVLVSFEGLAMPAPADTDRVLTEIYGDYLQLPPEDKRVTHHAFTAHWGSCPQD